MSDIALYNALRKIPEVSEAEAKEAVADVASSKEVATKSDIVRVEAAIAKQDAKIERMGRQIIMWVVVVGLAVVGLIKYL